MPPVWRAAMAPGAHVLSVRPLWVSGRPDTRGHHGTAGRARMIVRPARESGRTKAYGSHRSLPHCCARPSVVLVRLALLSRRLRQRLQPALLPPPKELPSEGGTFVGER